MKRIYIAGGSAERLTIVPRWVERIRVSSSLEVTHNWADEANYRRPAAECAQQDVSGVLGADVVWLLVPEAASEGMAFEFGIAHNAGIPVVASGPYVGRCIFHTLITHRFREHMDAFLWLQARGRDAA